MIFGTILKISKFFENVPHFIIIRTVRMDRRNIVVSLSLQMPEINYTLAIFLDSWLVIETSHSFFFHFFSLGNLVTRLYAFTWKCPVNNTYSVQYQQYKLKKKRIRED